MSRHKRTYLKQILLKIPNNTIVTTKWLEENGVSRQLLQKYKKSGWLKCLANGAYIKLSDTYNLDSAIYALQEQLKLSAHIGGLTALAQKHGKAHNLSYSRKNQIFAYREEKISKWFYNLFENNVSVYFTTFLPIDLGYEIFDSGSFKTKISSQERAILEMIYLTSNQVSLNEVYQVLELMVSVKPNLMQNLLENCNSIKVKRVFLYLANMVSHAWFKRLNINQINLGTGVRQITKKGIYDKKYNIIIEDIRS